MKKKWIILFGIPAIFLLVGSIALATFAVKVGSNLISVVSQEIESKNITEYYSKIVSRVNNPACKSGLVSTINLDTLLSRSFYEIYKDIDKACLKPLDLRAKDGGYI
jgi:hypothetical protein